MTILLTNNRVFDPGNGPRLRFLCADEVPAPSTFLSERELHKLSTLRVEKRRRDWLGGRYAAKDLIKEVLSLNASLSTIEIEYDPFGRPIASYMRTGKEGTPGSCLLSITHSGPFCAAGCSGEDAVFLGIDLEKVEPRAEAWYRDYFHNDELSGRRDNERLCDLATRLWTQKEALLKALGLGLKADPLDINLAGPVPEFTGAAAARYNELSRPPFTIRTVDHGPDYRLSLAWQS